MPFKYCIDLDLLQLDKLTHKDEKRKKEGEGKPNVYMNHHNMFILIQIKKAIIKKKFKLHTNAHTYIRNTYNSILNSNQKKK